MYNHAPKNYICPFCLIIQGVENEHTDTKQADIVYQDKFVTAWINSLWWPNNPGHVLIVPNQHFENFYDLPSDLSYKIQDLAKKVALAFKEVYQCDGTSTRQHNEPAGNQHVWHHHLHVFPRYKNDRLYQNNDQRKLIDPEKRLPYAEKIKSYLSK